MLEDGVFDDPVAIVNTKRVLSKTEGQPSQRWLYSHVHTIYEVIVPLCTTVLLTQYYQLWPIFWWLVRLWQTYHNIVDTTVRIWCDHCTVFIYICCAIYIVYIGNERLYWIIKPLTGLSSLYSSLNNKLYSFICIMEDINDAGLNQWLKNEQSLY